MYSFVEELQLIVARQQLLDMGGVADIRGIHRVAGHDNNVVTVDEQHRLLENRRKNLYMDATDDQLLDLAEQQAPLVGATVDSLLASLKEVRRLARKDEQWWAAYERARSAEAAQRFLHGLRQVLSSC